MNSFQNFKADTNDAYLNQYDGTSWTGEFTHRYMRPKVGVPFSLVVTCTDKSWTVILSYS